jgi:hypothetical protein
MSRTVRGSSREEETNGATVVATRPERIGPTATVRHFDQLSDRAQRAVVAAATGEAGDVRASDLERGEVIRFTEYYVVE